MLRSFTFKNIGPIGLATLKLEEDLTVLVGPNGSGKTTVLNAVARHRYQQRTGAREEASLRVILRSGVSGVTDKVAVPERPTVPSILLRLKVDRLRGQRHPEPQFGLTEIGDNLTNVIASLGRRRQEQLAKEVCRLLPTFGDVDVVPHGHGLLQLRFQDRWHPETYYDPNQVSDGTMLTLAWLTLRFIEKPPKLVAIEEIENGLHPYLLRQVLDVLKQIAQSEGVQFLLSTHSPLVLDHVDARCVRFLSRSPKDGSVTIIEAPADREEWAGYLEAFDDRLGDAWLSGGLGGVGGG